MLVSVIVPVYNIKDYIGRCLDSIIRQTYSNLEIIVIDDGSEDGSEKICDDFAKKDKRVKVFHRKNSGLSEARNFGIKKSSGEVLVLVDGDDFVKPGYVEKMYKAMEQTGADIVVCGYNDIILRSGELSGKEATIKLLVEQENYDIVAWNKMYKKELFIKNKIYYPRGKKHEDALTTYKLLSMARKVVYMPESLYCYVERSGSIMDKVKKEDRLKMRETAAEEAAEYFEKESDLEKAAEVAVLTAKFAYVDAGVRGEISADLKDSNLKWILKNKGKYNKNKYLTKKLKLYLWLVNILSGKGYLAFRTLI